MRIVKTIGDVQIVLNQLLDWKSKLESKSWDMHGLRITNAGVSIDPQDYVTKSELKSYIGAVPVVDTTYTQVFSLSSSPSDGEVSPPFVVQKGREGFPIVAWVAAINAPSTAICKVNIQYGGNSILPVDLELPIGSSGPVSTSTFVDPRPKLGTTSFMNAVVTTSGGVSLISIGLVIQVA